MLTRACQSGRAAPSRLPCLRVRHPAPPPPPADAWGPQGLRVCLLCPLVLLGGPKTTVDGEGWWDPHQGLSVGSPSADSSELPSPAHPEPPWRPSLNSGLSLLRLTQTDMVLVQTPNWGCKAPLALLQGVCGWPMPLPSQQVAHPSACCYIADISEHSILGATTLASHHQLSPDCRPRPTCRLCSVHPFSNWTLLPTPDRGSCSDSSRRSSEDLRILRSENPDLRMRSGFRTLDSLFPLVFPSPALGSFTHLCPCSGHTTLFVGSLVSWKLGLLHMLLP
ncbi:hypothetical protein VULLAG_LOCUS20467 [Vulpes lagopus]